MNSRGHLYAVTLLGVMVFSGCNSPHGKPSKTSEAVPPNQIADFATLYEENCAGCHGAKGRGGAALALADPVYLAIAGDAAIRKAITSGVRGSAMPAFAQTAGGMLTDKQIDVIASQIRSRWSGREVFERASAPAYAVEWKGDAKRGELAYKTYCETCHGPGGRGGSKGSAIAATKRLAFPSK